MLGVLKEITPFTESLTGAVKTSPSGMFFCPELTTVGIPAMEKLKSICQLVGYCEIEPNADRHSAWSSEYKLSNIYLPLIDSKFKLSNIKVKSDIWKSFRRMFSKRMLVSF